MTALALVGVLVFGGCGSSEDTAVESTVDEAALDTGDYPTEPYEPGLTDNDSITTYDGQQLARFVPPPWRINPIFTETRGSNPIRTIPELRHAIGPRAADLSENVEGMIYGFSSVAREPIASSEVAPRLLIQVALRYLDAPAADAAAQAIHNEYLTADYVESEQFQIPGMGDVLAVLRPKSDQPSLNAITTRDDMLIYSYVNYLPGKEDWAVQQVRASLDAMADSVPNFVGRPTKDQRGDDTRVEESERDPDRVLRYTIPIDDDEVQETGFGVYGAAYDPLTATHFHSQPRYFFDAMNEAGVKHEAIGKTVVFRAGSGEQAQGLRAYIMRDEMTSGATLEPAPQGLQDSVQCVLHNTSDGEVRQCTVVVGRYIGLARTADDQRDLWQRISAQYLILTKADQNHQD